MTIPRVKTALGASDTAMPAMPAPTKDYWGSGINNYGSLAISATAASYEIKAECTLLQISPSVDAKISFGAADANGYPLKSGGYFTFAVEPGSTMYVTAASAGTLTVLEG